MSFGFVLFCFVLFLPLQVQPLSPLRFPFPPPLGRFSSGTAEVNREERGGPTETVPDVPRRQVDGFINTTSGRYFQNNTVKPVYKVFFKYTLKVLQEVPRNLSGAKLKVSC